MMLSADNAEFVMGAVEADDFYRPAHRRMFECFSSLRREGYVPDWSSTRDWLRSHPDAAVVTDTEFNAVTMAGSSLGMRRATEIIVECSARRQVIARASETVDMAYDPAVPLGEVGAEAQKAVDASTMAVSNVPPG